MLDGDDISVHILDFYWKRRALFLLENMDALVYNLELYIQ
jgi:hypothetical protein